MSAAYVDVEVPLRLGKVLSRTDINRIGGTKCKMQKTMDS